MNEPLFEDFHQADRGFFADFTTDFLNTMAEGVPSALKVELRRAKINVITCKRIGMLGFRIARELWLREQDRQQLEAQS